MHFIARTEFLSLFKEMLFEYPLSVSSCMGEKDTTVQMLSYKQSTVADSYYPFLICNARNKQAQDKYQCPFLWLHLAAKLWKQAVKPLPTGKNGR